MDLFTTLTNELRLIGRVLDAFEVFLTSSEASGELDLVELNRVCVFLREFVELTHHECEEGLLLPAMESIGYGHNGGPLAHIRDEHARERRLVLDLRRAAVRKRVPPAERPQIVKLGRDLVAFERAHMKKENELLYPTVEQELRSRLADLNNKMAKRSTTGLDQIWLRSLADELIAENAPAETAPTAAAAAAK